MPACRSADERQAAHPNRSPPASSPPGTQRRGHVAQRRTQSGRDAVRAATSRSSAMTCRVNGRPTTLPERVTGSWTRRHGGGEGMAPGPGVSAHRLALDGRSAGSASALGGSRLPQPDQTLLSRSSRLGTRVGWPCRAPGAAELSVGGSTAPSRSGGTASIGTRSQPM